MSNAELVAFVARLRSDAELRERVAQAEQEAAVRAQPVKDAMDVVVEENWAALRRVAREHGYDISLDLAPPQELPTPSDQELSSAFCLLTCCWAVTSVWDGEGIPTVDGPGPPGTHSHFCS